MATEKVEYQLDQFKEDGTVSMAKKTYAVRDDGTMIGKPDIERSVITPDSDLSGLPDWVSQTIGTAHANQKVKERWNKIKEKRNNQPTS